MRWQPTSRFAVLLSATILNVLILGWSTTTSAQTFVWTGDGDGLNWSDDDNWLDIVPPAGGGTDDRLFFRVDSPLWASINDLAGTYVVNDIVFNLFGINSALASLEGNPISFAGSGERTLEFDGQGALAVANSLTFVGAATSALVDVHNSVGGVDPTLRLNGNLSGSANLVKHGDGRLVINGNNGSWLGDLLIDFDPNVMRLSEQPVITRYRDTNANLRTQLCRVISKAGLTLWPKLFQNLRSTRATELAADHPAHVAAEWMGHSTVVADKHYWRVTDSDFERAIQKAQQKASQDMGIDRQGPEQECEKPGDFQNRRDPVVDLVLPDGLEPSAYWLRADCEQANNLLENSLKAVLYGTVATERRFAENRRGPQRQPTHPSNKGFVVVQRRPRGLRYSHRNDDEFAG